MWVSIEQVQEAPHDTGHQKIEIDSYWSSPRKSLVKGERFMRSEENQEQILNCGLNLESVSPSKPSLLWFKFKGHI